jgi:hypothetical protein
MCKIYGTLLGFSRYLSSVEVRCADKRSALIVRARLTLVSLHVSK